MKKRSKACLEILSSSLRAKHLTADNTATTRLKLGRISKSHSFQLNLNEAMTRTHYESTQYAKKKPDATFVQDSN